ncbi:MAG: tetratricopeptide repeat protein [Planctomycetes bacterium]|nr:tetratricopeptide repeat protein [Planctomycetota bacterium]
MGLTIGRIVVIALVLGGAYLAYTKFGGKAELEQATTQNPYDVADRYMTGGLFDKALPAYEQALAASPNDPRSVDAQFSIARCLDQLKRDKEALEAYRAFAAKYPNNEHAKLAKDRVIKYENLGVR